MPRWPERRYCPKGGQGKNSVKYIKHGLFRAGGSAFCARIERSSLLRIQLPLKKSALEEDYLAHAPIRLSWKAKCFNEHGHLFNNSGYAVNNSGYAEKKRSPHLWGFVGTGVHHHPLSKINMSGDLFSFHKLVTPFSPRRLVSSASSTHNTPPKISPLVLAGHLALGRGFRVELCLKAIYHMNT